MNRNQRRLGRMHQKRYEDLRKHDKSKCTETEFEELLAPRNIRNSVRIEKFTTNKCCFVAPSHEDFGQITEENDSSPVDKYQGILKEQYGFDPIGSETINKLKELRDIICNNIPKVDCSSQYVASKKQSTVEFADAKEGSHWQNIDTVQEIDKYIGDGKVNSASCLYVPDSMRIAETPLIKVIVKKFSRLKKNNIELRKLDEKVVCLEYDVFIGNSLQPKEKLRAFFSIKPTQVSEECTDIPTHDIPESIKKTLNIDINDLKQLNEKEIEIIDCKIQENKSYLDDLKRILKRKQATFGQKRNTLDLKTLYQMAKRQSPLNDQFSSTNFFSKAELQEIKDLIIRKCASSVHGINRRTVKTPPGHSDLNIGVISQSIVAELWRDDDGKVI